jgi:thiamine-phosphate diphosphorylase
MRCDKKDLLLYAVTDRSWLNGETIYSQVEKALKGGATFVQLREKTLGREIFLAEAKEIKELCRQYMVPYVINDNVEIAIAIDADGVHVGQRRGLASRRAAHPLARGPLPHRRGQQRSSVEDWLDARRFI